MNSNDVIRIRDWFTDYVATFREDGQLHRFLQLKYEHSARVADEARDLAGDLHWPREEVCLAEALGWLHDIGRFSQFRDFQCFHDAISVNHGLRGWEDLQKHDILDTLNPYDQHILLTGIRHHNARELPADIDSECLRFLMLIRDADKLDIYNVVYEVCESGESERFAEMLPGVDIHAPPNPVLVEELRTTGSCSYTHARSLADIFLIQLCWIYTFNYVPSYARMARRNIIKRSSAYLPDDPAIRALIKQLADFMETTLADGRKPELVFA
ncbi:MAG: HD domain-containing protein [Spartobacteria bacterium]|nr:HD domain-containing protein [Spartobacteria bacterium]